ncbi:MAG: hypothetical protein GXP25_09035 [Planctomycetes bacterium]|nr:hypothetical protein [Planctomycetota bacterium]
MISQEFPHNLCGVIARSIFRDSGRYDDAFLCIRTDAEAGQADSITEAGRLVEELVRSL